MEYGHLCYLRNRVGLGGQAVSRESRALEEHMDGYISFVELATSGEKNCDSICAAMKELHELEFGSV